MRRVHTSALAPSKKARAGRHRVVHLTALCALGGGLWCCSALVEGELDDKPSQDDPTTNVTCGAEPTPPGGTCPAICDNDCVDDVCEIHCSDSDSCRESTIDCPASFACQVICDGAEPCANATINCPDLYVCDIRCRGGGGCRDGQINCSDTGICSVECGSHGSPCSETRLECGQNACLADCESDSGLVQICGSSCDCQGC